jgi:hypothetical protein
MSHPQQNARCPSETAMLICVCQMDACAAMHPPLCLQVQQCYGVLKGLRPECPHQVCERFSSSTSLRQLADQCDLSNRRLCSLPDYKDISASWQVLSTLLRTVPRAGLHPCACACVRYLAHAAPPRHACKCARAECLHRPPIYVKKVGHIEKCRGCNFCRDRRVWQPLSKYY